MKKSFLIVGILAISFTSCKNDTEKKSDKKEIDSTTVQVDAHNSKNSLNYEGTYKGNLPCADCEAIETTIYLSKNSYSKETIYRGKSNDTNKEIGKFTWNEAGNIITLSGSDAPNQYFVGENVLFHLDMNGKRIEGDLASNYKLTKVENSDIVVPNTNEDSKTNETAKLDLKNSKWRLVKLNGKMIKKSKDSNKEFGIIFNKDGNFSAFAGCNNLFGTYKLEKNSKITFSSVGTTLMACDDMITEQEFAKVLKGIDNYNFDGKTLKLNKAKMASLAEFEIIK